jgi:hypothetical protein
MSSKSKSAAAKSVSAADVSILALAAKMNTLTTKAKYDDAKMIEKQVKAMGKSSSSTITTKAGNTKDTASSGGNDREKKGTFTDKKGTEHEVFVTIALKKDGTPIKHTGQSEWWLTGTVDMDGKPNKHRLSEEESAKVVRLV